MAEFKPKDPNFICSFEITKNKNKDPNNPEHKNRPDYVLIDSEKLNKKGEPFVSVSILFQVVHFLSTFRCHLIRT